jgi:HD-like signal output (HDOD) protein
MAHKGIIPGLVAALIDMANQAPCLFDGRVFICTFAVRIVIIGVYQVCSVIGSLKPQANLLPTSAFWDVLISIAQTLAVES